MSNFNPGNFYKTIDRYGTEIILEGAPDFIPNPINYTPAASGNTQNINEFVISPNGDIFFVDKDGEAFKVNTAQTVTTITDTITGHKIASYTNENGVVSDINETITVLGNLTYDPVTGLLTIPYTDEAGVVNNKTATIASLNVLTTAQPTPTATGNTTNLNSAFKDAAGNTWVVDSNGDAILTGTAVSISNVQALGNKIADIIIGGVTTSINETITSISAFSISGNTITLTYIDEAGATNTKTLDVPSDVITNITNTVTGHKIGTYTNESGVAVDINETITTITNIADGSATGIANLIGTYTNEDGIEVDINENVTQLTELNSAPIKNGIAEFKNEQGAVTIIEETVTSVSDFSISGNTITLSYVDETGTTNTETLIIPSDVVTTLTNTVTGNKIGTYTNESGVAVDINETVTSLVDNGDGTITYTDENGTPTIITLGSEGAPVTVGTNTPTGTSVEGAIHLVTDDGTPTGTVLEQYIYDTDSGVWIEMQRNAQDLLKFGTASPTANGEWDGEEYFVTSNGQHDGSVLEQWIWDKQSASWIQRPTSASELVQFGTTAPTVTTGFTAGDEYFVTSDGTSAGSITAQYIFDGTSWVLRPSGGSSALITTSITPQVYNGTSFVSAQANAPANVADLLLLSDGQRIHDGEVTWTGHGLTVGSWYYLDQNAPGSITATKPTSGLVQQLFFVEDANTIHVDIEEAWQYASTQTYSQTVYVNATSPSSATIFDVENPPVTNDDALKANDSYIYVGTDGSMWTYNTSTGTYSTYTPTASYAVSAHSPAAKSVPTSTNTTLTNYGTTLANNAGTAWNATTGEFTVPRAGYYQVTGQVEYASASWVATNILATIIQKNGTNAGTARQYIQANHTSGWTSNTVTGIVYCAVGDVLKLTAFQATGSAKTTNATGSTYLTIHEIK